MITRTVFVGFTSAILLCSCSSMSERQTYEANGAVAGAAVGAGTGAIIGSAITHGDVGLSAALGAGIGIPAGALVGLAIYQDKAGAEISRNSSRIEENRADIAANQAAIDDERESVLAETSSINIDRDREQYIYTGAKLGVRTR